MWVWVAALYGVVCLSVCRGSLWVLFGGLGLGTILSIRGCLRRYVCGWVCGWGYCFGNPYTTHTLGPNHHHHHLNHQKTTPKQQYPETTSFYPAMVVENNLKLPRQGGAAAAAAAQEGEGSEGGGKRAAVEEYHALLWFDEDEDEKGQPRLVKVCMWIGVWRRWMMWGGARRDLFVLLYRSASRQTINTTAHTRSHIQVPLRLVTAIPDAFKGEGMG